jgi:hypothetical protein
MQLTSALAQENEYPAMEAPPDYVEQGRRRALVVGNGGISRARLTTNHCANEPCRRGVLIR